MPRAPQEINAVELLYQFSMNDRNSYPSYLVCWNVSEHDFELDSRTWRWQSSNQGRSVRRRSPKRYLSMLIEATIGNPELNIPHIHASRTHSGMPSINSNSVVLNLLQVNALGAEAALRRGPLAQLYYIS